MALQPTNAEAATLDLAGSIAENERLAKEIRATAESMERELGEGGAGEGGAGGGGGGGAAPGAQRPPEPRIARYQPHAEMPALAGGKAALVAHMRDWDYGPGGVFERQAELGGHALYHTAAEGLHHFGVCAKLGVDPAKLNNWLLAVEKCMRPAREVMYHNATHVCDVVHAAWWVLEQGGLAEMMQPRAVFAALCAAAAHDTGHPGLNNVFWAASGSELALSYHGRSVLENYHIYQAFALMRDPEANIFDGMSDEDAKFVREAMIDAIIATDLAYHDDHNRAAFQQKVQAGGAASFSLDNDDDQRMLVLMCLKLSDLANPCKGWDVYVRWIDCLFQEFYAQGEVEARQGLTTAPHMDRNGPTCPAKAQQGFITYLLRPLLEEWLQVLPTLQPLLAALEQNLSHLAQWETEQTGPPHVTLRQ